MRAILAGFKSSLFHTVAVTFHIRERNGVRPDGQPSFAYRKEVIEECLYFIDQPSTEDEHMRYHSTSRLQVHIPKGNESIDLTGALVEAAGNVYEVDGNSTFYMPENTPGPFNRSITAYRREEYSVPIKEADLVV